MAKPSTTPSGYICVTEQHKWMIMVSCGRNQWEDYDTVFTWTPNRNDALAKCRKYGQFQAYLKNTGRRYTIRYVSCDSFPNRPLYLTPKEYA